MASRLYLPKLDPPPATIFEHLCARFPHIASSVWTERIRRGLVTADGTAIQVGTPYRQGITVSYHRESESEPEAPHSESVIYADAEIMVVDKPHGMPVTPAGEYVQRSLLRRLETRWGIPDIAPLHRLDRDTAGLVLFSVNAATRARYHALFAKRTIEREYFAVARLSTFPAPDQRSWLVENRIGGGQPWFRQAIVDGAVNAVTEIELLEIRADQGLFRLRPRTGRKHQLRVHMASIGFPIVGDRLYPTLQAPGQDDPSLQLLAARLSFADPITGTSGTFVSAQTLSLGAFACIISSLL